MNPNQQPMGQPTMPQQQTLQGSLHPTHNQIYEMLRQTLMQLHAQGIPGMDKVLNALNNTHVGLMKGQQPQMPQQSMQPPIMPRSQGQ